MGVLLWFINQHKPVDITGGPHPVDVGAETTTDLGQGGETCNRRGPTATFQW